MDDSLEIVPMDPGDSAFLGRIYEQHRDILFTFALKYAGNWADADDALQNAFIKLINYIPDLKTMHKNRRLSYLRVTVKTSVIDIQRKKKPELSLNDAYFAILAAREQDLLSDLSLDWKLEKLRKELSPRDWLVLESKFILGYSDKEIAAILGVKPSSIRMILSRAYSKSRGILNVGVR